MGSLPFFIYITSQCMAYGPQESDNACYSKLVFSIQPVITVIIINSPNLCYHAVIVCFYSSLYICLDFI